MTHPAQPSGLATVTPLPRVFRPRRSAPTDVVRPTRAEISLPNLRFNLRALQRRTRASVWCVVKADAYGHGAKACARTLERAGAGGICVALLEEGIELRNAGISVPILVMGGYYGRAYGELLAHQLTPVLCDPGQIEEFAREVRYRGCGPVAAHVKVDTGMSRLGVVPADTARAAEALGAAPELIFEGLMTHFAQGDIAESVDEQLAVFSAAQERFAAVGLRPRLRHAANTAALLTQPQAHFDIVRPGLGLYGVEPVPGIASELRPVMRVTSTVIALRALEPGQSAGYGALWTAQRSSVLATIPIGYADGLSRSWTNRGQVLVKGTSASVVGAVSMDLTTIDVTDVPGVKVGDEVVVLGTSTNPCDGAGLDLSAAALAHRQGTIPWEILTQVSRRVPRFYRGA